MSAHEPRGDAPALADRLAHERPVPAGAFRGGLRRRLAAARAGRPRPPHLWRRVGACAVAGTVLLALAAASIAGAGPLGA